MSPPINQQLRSIISFPELITYLCDELSWPIEVDDFDAYTFEWDAQEDFGVSPEHAAKIKEIKQLRPLTDHQPWGVFFIEFEPKKLPVVVLRRLLNKLVTKKRASANPADRQTWSQDDLLFVASFGQDAVSRELAFAHFHHEEGDLPTLRVLGWDGSDTPLKLDHVDKELHQNLRWPDDVEDLDAWRTQWSKAFRHRIGHTIQTADMLAKVLADLAKSIRNRCHTMIQAEPEGGPLRKLFKAFQTALIHDLTEEGFADTYAQTITYGLLTAAISRTDMTGGADGTFVQAENVTDMVPVTNPFLKEMLQTFLHAGGREGGLDFDELGVQDVVELLRGDETDLPSILRDFDNRNPNEDPVIRFYEDFLSAYNKKLKILRGVFYTPKPVVSYIVRSVHELLQTKFGLEDGLASTATWGEVLKKHPDLKLSPKTDEPGDMCTIEPDEFFVQILDPATGTATFLVEVIEVIYQTLISKWQKDGMSQAEQGKAWNEYVPECLLPRLHGYELMMAPYAIAHMKLGLKLFETGYRFGSNERAAVYLTNALEPKVTQLPQIGFDALAHEAAAVNDIKWYKRFTVVIGNPPYSGISSNMSDYAQHIVDAYRFVDGAPLNEKKLWLQDDYVKFIRKAQETLDTPRVGVFGFITNHGYLDNPTFRGMRQSLMGTFSHLCLLDLHGNANKKERPPDGSEDKNVFDIRQGVAICLATRGGVNRTVEHADVWGEREHKYTWLSNHSVSDTEFSTLSPDSPYYFFEPQNIAARAEYGRGWKINEAMPANCAGFITARDHFVVDFNRDVLLERLSAFASSDLSDTEIRTTYFAGCGSAKYPDGDTRGWKVPEARERVANDAKWRERVRTCLYRPFDMREVYWADWMIDWPRPELMRHLDLSNNKAFITTRITKDTFSLFPTRTPPGHKSVGAYDVNYVFPLWAAPDQSSLFSKHSEAYPNFSLRFLESLAAALGLDVEGPHSLPVGLTPEDIFHYIYAVFHSPGYRNRYAEFLKSDFPRLPLLGSLQLFRALVRLGRELVALHLLESPALSSHIAHFIGESYQVSKVGWSADGGGTVWIDGKGSKSNFKCGSSGFQCVPSDVWDFHIGGYQVCEKWLKDRGPKKGKPGRTLTTDDITHYQKIIVAISETIRIMTEIDEVIDEHGGWPGAFITGEAATETEVYPIREPELRKAAEDRAGYVQKKK